MVTVQAQSIRHTGNVAVRGVAVIVFLDVIAGGGDVELGIRQAYAGGNAVAQSHIGIGVIFRRGVRRKSGHGRCQQHHRRQQQAEKTFSCHDEILLNKKLFSETLHTGPAGKNLRHSVCGAL